MMSGQVWVESEPGKGSTFIFTAWFGLGSKEKPISRAVPEVLDGMRALVVDDNVLAREVLQNILTSLRFRVQSAGPERVVDYVGRDDRDDPFGLVLMDTKISRESTGSKRHGRS